MQDRFPPVQFVQKIRRTVSRCERCPAMLSPFHGEVSPTSAHQTHTLLLRCEKLFDLFISRGDAGQNARPTPELVQNSHLCDPRHDHVAEVALGLERVVQSQAPRGVIFLPRFDLQTLAQLNACERGGKGELPSS